MSTKQKFLLGILFLTLNVFSIIIIIEKTNSVYVRNCGVVVKKYTNNDIEYHKSGTTSSINMYLDVKLDNGKYEQISVTTDNFYKNEVGDKICVTKEERKSTTTVLLQAIAFLIVIGDFFVVFYLICILIEEIWSILSDNS